MSPLLPVWWGRSTLHGTLTPLAGAEKGPLAGAPAAEVAVVVVAAAEVAAVVAVAAEAGCRGWCCGRRPSCPATGRARRAGRAGKGQ